MKYSRIAALFFGISIGFGCGLLFIAWIISDLANKVESIKYISVFGDEKAAIVFIIGGLVLIAIGIIFEVYIRGKINIEKIKKEQK